MSGPSTWPPGQSWDTVSLKYWRKQLSRADKWLKASPREKPKSVRSIKKWTKRKEEAEAHVAELVQRMLSR
jgi:hypothetical protein